MNSVGITDLNIVFNDLRRTNTPLKICFCSDIWIGMENQESKSSSKIVMHEIVQPELLSTAKPFAYITPLRSTLVIQFFLALIQLYCR